MRICITFQHKVNSRELYEELKDFKVNVTDLDTTAYAYRNDLLLVEIPQILAICDKYGLYDLSITK